MAVRLIRTLEPVLRNHVICNRFNGQLHVNASWALQITLGAGLGQVLQEPGEEGVRGSLERRLLDFVEGGGIILYVKDGSDIVGSATVGCCPGLRSESFMVEDLKLAKLKSIMPDRVYEALLGGIQAIARLISETKECTVVVHVGAASSERRLLRRIFERCGFWEEADAPDIWLTSVSS